MTAPPRTGGPGDGGEPGAGRLDPASAQPVSWLELFFDLIFVTAFDRLAQRLGAHLELREFGIYALMFLALWWAWFGNTSFAARSGNTGRAYRWGTPAQMLALAALAVSVRGDLDDVGPFFALTYAAGRVLLVLMMVAHGRATGQLSDGDRTLVRGFSLGAVLWVASAALSGPLQLALWGLALLVDVLSVLRAERSQDRDLPHQSHFPERVGLLFIVFLGAVVTELIRGAAEQRLQFADQLPAALAFLTIMAVWRLYFDEAHTLPAVLAGRSGESGNLLAWSYTHLPLTLALSVLSIGLGLGIAEEGREADRHERLLVSGTLAVIFLCLAALRALSARPLGLQAGGLRVSGGSRLGAAALVLLLIPAPLGTTAYEALCAVITLAVAYLGWRDPVRSQLSKIEDVLNEEAGPAGQQRG